MPIPRSTASSSSCRFRRRSTSGSIITRISPDKDVDGFHPVNAGRLAIGLHGFVPCTPLGCLMLLKQELGDLTGLDAIVVGRSNIVGKPMALLLLQAKLHGDDRPFAHPRPARRGPPRRHRRRGGRPARADPRRLAQARRDRDRRRIRSASSSPTARASCSATSRSTKRSRSPARSRRSPAASGR